jgi:HD-GYP domain-containing protein (c-di-GMP phosphodiesterase class II)
LPEEVGAIILNSPAPPFASGLAFQDLADEDHLERMQRYVAILLDHCHDSWSITPEYKAKIVHASVLHDAGKSVIPLEILTKPSALTEEEFDTIKHHTVAAAEVFARAGSGRDENDAEQGYYALAMDIALHHHEKWDGSGYPLRLRGEEIPFPARVIAIADVYDALTSQRPYKKPWSHEDAFRTIVDDSGLHFDPALVEVFKSCAEKFKTASGNEGD